MDMTMSEFAKLAPWILKFGSHRALEKATGRRPRTLDDVPQSAEAITPEWLTLAICNHVPGAAVTSVRAFGGSDGTTSRRALEVTYNDVGFRAGLPPRLFTKATTHLPSRLTGVSIGKIAMEVGFYREFRPDLESNAMRAWHAGTGSLPAQAGNDLGVEATRALYAGADARSGRSLIIFEDLVALQGCRFLEPAAPVDRDMAEQMIDLLARIQARFWEDPRFDGRFKWLRTPFDYMHGINAILPFENRSNLGIQRALSVMPPALVGRDKELWAAHMRSLELSSRAPRTIIHWDVHIGNWYQTGEGRMGLSDWGMLHGSFAADLAYALSSALTIETRRAWERDLVQRHVTRLAEFGVANPPSFDEAWLAYRQQMFHPLYFWLVTIGAGALQPDMQPNRICLANIERMATAVTDLDSLKALDE